MKRYLLTIASGVSLLLGVTLVGLWVRSYSARDAYYAENANWDFTFESNSGVLHFVEHRGLPKHFYKAQGFGHDKPYPVEPSIPFPGEPGIRSQLRVPGLSWLISDGGTFPTVPVPAGISSSFMPGGGPFTFYPSIRANVSYWLVLALAGILPTLRLLAWRRDRYWREKGCCPICGYDLRASTDRCPECGTQVLVGQDSASL